ncbi:MAG: IS30 family transposase [Afipia sp.]|nr:IS30 family transposase [Afipia sp.]
MDRRYAQLSLEDRCAIAALHAEGRSIRQIASTLDRSPSTVSRELKRNSGRQVGYKPAYAQAQTRARRWKGARLERDATLREQVLEGLRRGWSPEQVCGFLARQHGGPVIAPESIYRFIHAQLARTNDYSWRRYLPRGKSKRGFRGRKGGSSALHIEARVPIALRPAQVEDRSVAGHWEADLMMFSRYGQAILTLHERSSRLLIAVRLPGKAARPVAQIIARLLAPLPPELRQTITFDNVLRAEGNREDSQKSLCTPACSRSMTLVKLHGRTRRLPRVKEKISSIANTGYADCGPHRPQHELLIQVEDPNIIYRVIEAMPSRP